MTSSTLRNTLEVVGAEDHILRRNGDRLTVGGLEQVARGEHQEAGFRLRLRGEGYVYRHLVAVEVGVERGTDEGMELDRASLNEDGLKRLDAQTVECRRAVEHDGVSLDDDLESVPDAVLGALDRLSGGLDVLRRLGLDKALHDEGLEELESHLLGQTALVHLQLRADDDNGTSRVVNALSEKVLAETSLLALEHIGEGLEGAVVGARDRSAASAVVDQGVNGLLEHTLLVADDDLGGVELEELLETVVSVDDAAVEVVEVGGREAAAVELYHRTDIGGNDGNHVEDHPFGAVAREQEALHHVEPLEDADPLLAGGGLQLLAQLLGELFEVDFREQLLDGLGAHARLKIVLIFFAHIVVFFFTEHLVLREVAAVAGVGDDVL